MGPASQYRAGWKDWSLLGQFIGNRWFALVELFLVIGSSLILYLWPSVGGWVLLVPLVPWCLRLISAQPLFQRTSFDWLILIFVITACVGYWAAYDEPAARHKFWLILLAVLFYFALSRQPKENLAWIAGIVFSIGVGISIYFFLTHDFVELPRKLPVVNDVGRWIMQVRPGVQWKPIHPNYVAGIAAITAPFAYFLFRMTNATNGKRIASYTLLCLSMLIVTLAILMATSRGVMLALLSAGGIWFLWRSLISRNLSSAARLETIFPIFVCGCLALILIFLYAGPASFTGSVAPQSFYGSSTRAELFTRSLYFLKDYPFTGAGFNSFPGLYSFYMLGIPTFYLLNSHNLFLDVAIEQGVIAGISYLFLFLASVWLVSRSIMKTESPEMRLFGWLTLSALMISIVHGMVDDYLYNGNGAVLALVPIGMSMIVKRESLGNASAIARHSYRAIGLAAVLLVGMGILNLDRLRSAWYANLGAVEMERVVLADFPTNQWTDAAILPRLGAAESPLLNAHGYDAENQTANYRLGIISLLRQDFGRASNYLEAAYREAPGHRGIVKNLGYSYAWLGETDKAQMYLESIPEAESELDVYAWWWDTQGRQDLSANAKVLAARLKSTVYQH